MKNPYKIETYTTNEHGLFNRFGTTNYDGRVLRNKLLNNNITYNELVILKELYKIIRKENSKSRLDRYRAEEEVKKYTEYDDLLDNIRKLPKEILMYHINTISGMLLGWKKYNLTKL